MKTLFGMMLILAILVPGMLWAEDTDLEAKPGIQAEPAAQLKSPGTATSLSLVGFLVPIGLTVLMATGEESGGGDSSAVPGIIILGGSIFGPGLGHAYAGEGGKFWKGAGLRSLAWGGFIVALAASWDDPDAQGGAVIAVASGALYLASAISDIVTADDSVRKHNERVQASQVTLGPIFVPRDRSVGMQVAVRF